MEFKNSISILFSNIGYVFKLIVWILISALISAGIGAAIIIPVWKTIAATTNVMPYVDAIGQSLTSVWKGGINLRVAAEDIVPNAIAGLKAMSANAGAVTGLAFEIAFVYALYCFLRGLCFYSLADIVNQIMASNMRQGFASSMAANFKKNVTFSLCRLSIGLPIDIAYALIMVAAALGLFTKIGLIAVPILLIFSVVFFSLRAVLFGGWLPRALYHPEERIYTAFTRSLVYVKHNFTDLFKAYAIIFSLMYILNYLCAAPTGGIVLIVLIPTHYFLLRAVELIGYYKAKGMSFYLDGSTVVNTVDYGFRPDNQREDDYFELDKNADEAFDAREEQTEESVDRDINPENAAEDDNE